MRRIEHVAHDLEHVRALALDGGADGVAVGVAALQEDDGAADRERGVGLVHRGGVHEWGGEQRHERRAPVAPALHVGDQLVDRVRRRLALQRGGGDEPVPEQGALVPEHALGQAGGAAGVPEQEVVARALDPRRGRVGAQQLLVGRVGMVVVELDEVPEARHAVACAGHPLAE